MGFKNTENTYGTGAKIFHWVVALIVLGLLVLGFFMVSMEFGDLKFSLYGWHKSFGTLLLLLVCFRLGWRWMNIRVKSLPTHGKWERVLSKSTHLLLYFLLIAMPLTGWIMSNAGGYSHNFFGLFEVPTLTGKNKPLFEDMRLLHEIFAFSLVALISLHFAGALKHHFLDKDATLKRMVPFVRSRYMVAFVVLLSFLFLERAVSLGGAYWPRGHAYKIIAPVEGKVVVSDLEASKPAEASEISSKEIAQWAIVPEESTLAFSVNVEDAPYTGTFEMFGGDIFFDENDLANSRVDIVIDLASVKSQSLEWNKYLANVPWFYTEKFPESRFVANRFEKTDETHFLAHGNLTLKGVTQPVILRFSLEYRNNDAGEKIAVMNGSTSFSRTAFDVGAGEWSSPDTVGREVNIDVSLAAKTK